MAVTFHIPGPLRVFSGGLPSVKMKTAPATMGEAFEDLCAQYPGMRDRVVNEAGQVRAHINIFVGNQDIRYTGDFATRLPAEAEISIIPAVSGGSSRSRRGARKRKP